MMSEYEFSVWCAKNNVSSLTSDYINKNIRQAQPARAVGGGEIGLSGRYPSKKMGLTIQTESGKVEGPAVLMLENDDDVIEYYDQPNKIKLNYINNAGKNGGSLYTPDFFVIRKNSAGWEEWKNEEDLIKLAKAQKWKYQKDESQEWRCEPGEEFAAYYGLTFKVCTNKQINWNLHRNYVFLDDFLRKKQLLDVKVEHFEEIKKILFQEPGITLKQLIDFSMNHKFKSDDVFISIIKSDIFVDLYAAPLAMPEMNKVFLHREHADMYKNLMECDEGQINVPKISLDVGSKVLWDNQVSSIINSGDKNISLLSDGKYTDVPKDLFIRLINEGKVIGEKIVNEENEPVIDMITSASESDYKIANYRLQHVKNYLKNGSKEYKDKTEPNLRKVRDWVSKYREAIKLFGNGYVGLLPKDKDKGNRNERYNIEVVELMDYYIENEFETMIQKNRSLVYGAFKNACEAKGYHPPSLPTFNKRIDERPIVERTEKRQGKRAKYQKEAFYWELESTTPRHGDFPFNIGHLDHTELDIELVCSSTGKNLGKPYLTLLIDAFSRRVLAFYISFESPSHRSCMMVFRDCVRRYNRLPQQIVVDNGKEFHSVYFETLLAMYEREPKWRPPAKPRFGSVLERLFGTTNTSVIHNLKGNTKIMKNVRIVTKSNNPKSHASWSLPNLSKALEEFFFDNYDTIEHPALGQTPREAFENGIFYSGERKEFHISYDRIFEILTLPSTPRGEVTIQPSGIKVNYIYYWNDEFNSLRFSKKKVKVRYDPYNLGIAYAYVNKRWIRCTSEYYPIFSKLTVKELAFVTAEIKKTKQNHSKGFTINAQKIAKFIDQLENSEQYSVIKTRAEETKKVIHLNFNNKSNHDDLKANFEKTIQQQVIKNENDTSDEPILELYGEF
ncbi:TnsA endonuclease N-terminal domain-containing protein [Bacillus salipaludis]|uniref:TnsA endonuclease N-terminal domain-containing protein n=1 Tax=Bacillus salipaludis TaxID=2547811 RepID=A0ABW8R9I2_9BACI